GPPDEDAQAVEPGGPGAGEVPAGGLGVVGGEPVHGLLGRPVVDPEAESPFVAVVPGGRPPVRRHGRGPRGRRRGTRRSCGPGRSGPRPARGWRADRNRRPRARPPPPPRRP